MTYNASIHIGTSGWSYKHWKNIFYPQGLPQSEWLNYYAGIFDSTEINNSFYRLLKTTTTESWKKKVPPGFIFCPKMSRYLSHMKKLNDPEESMQRFFDALAPLKKNTGPVLIQLPPTVAFHSGKTEHRYQLCKKQYSYFRFAMEVQHHSWFSPASINLMKQYHIAFVISVSDNHYPLAGLITAQHIYVRFHGPEARYASVYGEKQLTDFAFLFNRWKKEGHSVWAFFNNDIAGYAITNAIRLKALCESVKEQDTA